MRHQYRRCWSCKLRALSSRPRPCRNGSRPSVPGPPISSEGVPERTTTSRASMLACATSSSTARASTRCAKPRSSSRAGGGTTIRSGRTHRSVTSRPHQKCSYLHSQCRCATSTGSASHAGETTASKLTFQPDHSVGADHVSIVCTIKAPVPVRAEDGLDPPYLHGR